MIRRKNTISLEVPEDSNGNIAEFEEPFLCIGANKIIG
jgi:hypothetical protein